MKVQDAMMRTPAYCSPETNLGSAVELLLDRDCGFLPIVDARQKLIGVVTDRDLCVALGTRNRLPGQITVGEVATGRSACRLRRSKSPSTATRRIRGAKTRCARI